MLCAITWPWAVTIPPRGYDTRPEPDGQESVGGAARRPRHFQELVCLGGGQACSSEFITARAAGKGVCGNDGTCRHSHPSDPVAGCRASGSGERQGSNEPRKDAISSELESVRNRVNNEQLPLEGLVERIPDVFCWVNRPKLSDVIRIQKASFSTTDPSVNASVHRIANSICPSIAWHA